MKTFLTILFGATLTASSGQTSNNIKSNQNSVTITQIDTTSEHLIYKGQLVEVYAEKTIFHSITNNNFLLKFTLKNISNKTIGLDLTNYWKVIYPNQWGFYKKPYIEVINEIQIIPDKSIDTTKIFKKFKEDSLTMIKPNETLEYYRDWNGSGENVELKNREEYLIISIDGQLLFTDGVQLEHLTLNEADEAKRVVVLNYPVNHKTVPEKSLIIKQK